MSGHDDKDDSTPSTVNNPVPVEDNELRMLRLRDLRRMSLLSIDRGETKMCIPLTVEEQYLSCILDKEVSEISPESEDEKNRKISASFFFKQLKTTTSVEGCLLNRKGNRVKVNLDSPKSSGMSLTTLDFVVCEDLDFYSEKIMKEVDFLYRRISHDKEAILAHKNILCGNIAVTLNKKTGKYSRVRILGDFESKDKKIVCKLLDEFGEVRVCADGLFKLIEYYGKYPANVQQLRLEDLRHYDACVVLKKSLLSLLSIKSGAKSAKEFSVEFTGRVDEREIALGYLTDDENVSKRKESINLTIMNELLIFYHDSQLFSKIGDNVPHLHVTHMLPSGNTYLQNQTAPMFQHLTSLLSLFPSRRKELVGMKMEAVTYEDFYLLVDEAGEVCRVEAIPPQNIFAGYDYENGVCIDFSDRGGRPLKPIPASSLYLASDLDPILSYLPRQCCEVKLFGVPSLPLRLVSLARNLFPPDELFSAVAAGKECENGVKIFSVELYNEKNSKVQAKPIDSHQMTVYLRNSVNAQFLKLIKDEDEKKVCLTTLKPCYFTSSNFLTLDLMNPNLVTGTKTTALIESIYSYDDFKVIRQKDVEKRREMEIFLTEYMENSAKRKWTQASPSYVDTHPDAVFVVTTNLKKGGPKMNCRAVVVRDRIQSEALKKVRDSVPVVQVLLLEYAEKRLVPIQHMDIICIPEYCTMPPLAARASVNKKKSKAKNKSPIEQFNLFEELEGQTAAVHVNSHRLDDYNQMWLSLSFQDLNTKTRRSSSSKLNKSTQSADAPQQHK